ncbi:Long-chain-fatty-acid--CoA ligase [Corynebacterium occultum]|uniref:Long-chain-fatty-acid--CoA ligase n=2 Tax=Corynebacterium occultum TaxID=2675219 RepID=A0A6B8W4J4_9CORY|nr:Long-chain-fatty-acid--CoA ligase [Corynebacterium occultum]
MELARQFIESVPSLAGAGALAFRGVGGVATLGQSVTRWGMSFAFLAEAAASHSPKHPAIIDDMGQMSYLELRDGARALARGLQARGVRAGHNVGVLARNSRVSPLALIACAYLGASPLIMNPYSSGNQVSAILRQYKGMALVADAEYVGEIENLEGIQVILGYNPEPESLPENVSRYPGIMEVIATTDPNIPLPFRPTQHPTIIMSSGTTGTPKGVVRGVPKTPQVLGAVLPKVPWRLGGTIQLSASLFHAWGWLNLNISLLTKSTMVLRRNFDPVQAVSDCIEYRINGVVSAAVFLRDFIAELEQAENADPKVAPKVGPMEFIVSSGNAIPPSLVRTLNARFGPVVCNFYGSTEHGPIAVASGAELAEDPDRAGTVATGVRTIILDEDLNEVPAGQVGEIYSANSESMHGYLSEKDQVRSYRGMLATGDLGFFDEQGYLHVRGRADDMVIKGGENVYPRELEEFLVKQEGIADVFVKGVQNDIIADLNCYVVRDDTEAGRSLDNEAVRQLAADNLAWQNVPDHIVWCDHLPRNDAGKVVPRELPQIKQS